MDSAKNCHNIEVLKEICGNLERHLTTALKSVFEMLQVQYGIWYFLQLVGSWACKTYSNQIGFGQQTQLWFQ